MLIMQNTNANYAKIKLVYPELSFKVNGILFKVKKDLGGFKSEKQYCDAIEAGLKVENIKYEREKVLSTSFIGESSNRNCLNKKLGILVNMRNYHIKPKRVLNSKYEEE